MGELVDMSTRFPTVVFTVLLLVVVLYWLMVLLGALGLDALDVGTDTEVGAGAAGGLGGFVASVGLGRVPLTVVLSLLIMLSWFASLVGNVLLDRIDVSTPVLVALAVGVLVVAVVLAWLVTSLVATMLRRSLPDAEAPSRNDFVGRTCVVRTSEVSPTYGQAEVTAEDGSTAVIQVRQTEQSHREDPLAAGSTALIFDFDTGGEFFWVTPFDTGLGPQLPAS